jgi:hypothetical protein
MVNIFTRDIAVIATAMVAAFVCMLIFLAYVNTNHQYYTTMRHCIDQGGTWVMDFQNSSARICQVGNPQ